MINLMNKISLLDGDLIHDKSIFTYCDRDNLKHDRIIVTDRYLDSILYNKIRVAWLIEPPEVNGNSYKLIKQAYKNFNLVVTSSLELASSIPNGVLMPLGGTFIKANDFLIYQKSKNISMVTSNKNYTSGHRFRLSVANVLKSKIDIFGSEGMNLPYKLDGLKDYRYSVSIENQKYDYWFTEKLLDCFVCGTIPIYWGCPSISSFFNSSGMLCFNEISELPSIMEMATIDFYESRMEAIKENFILAKKYVNPYDSVYNMVAAYGKHK